MPPVSSERFCRSSANLRRLSRATHGGLPVQGRVKDCGPETGTPSEATVAHLPCDRGPQAATRARIRARRGCSWLRSPMLRWRTRVLLRDDDAAFRPFMLELTARLICNREIDGRPPSDNCIGARRRDGAGSRALFQFVHLSPLPPPPSRLNRGQPHTKPNKIGCGCGPLARREALAALSADLNGTVGGLRFWVKQASGNCQPKRRAGLCKLAVSAPFFVQLDRGCSHVDTRRLTNTAPRFSVRHILLLVVLVAVSTADSGVGQSRQRPVTLGWPQSTSAERELRQLAELS